ncbi:MAG: Mur ligase family protein [Proteobacteria bacterium]|nr:Mur ligase family protein [Pseudomonadota bacterium]
MYYHERIKINDEFISDEKIAQYSDTIFKKCRDIPLTFFEFTTLLCFMHFVEEKIEFAVIETGLGGRFDATNVIKPEICIITSIAMDHMEYLGSSLEDIAKEKAGILKNGAYAVISHTPCDDFLIKAANNAGIKKTFVMGSDFEYYVNKDKSFDVHIRSDRNGEKIEYKNLKKSLNGQHQYKNAACAAMAFNLLNIHGTEKTINNALENVSWRGRLEKINIKDKTVYLDVSHNIEGIFATIKFLLEYHKNEAIHITCGFMKDKDYDNMINALHKVADKMFLIPTVVEGRQITRQDYMDVIDPTWKNVCVCEDYKDAFNKTMKENGVIVFTGSIFNFEEISKLLEEYR